MHVILGLLIMCFSIIIIIRKLGVLEKHFNVYTLFMFTHLTILLCWIFYAVELFFVEKNYTFSCLKFYLMIYMVIVMLIYNFVLVPQARRARTGKDIYSFYDCIAHIGLPLLVVIDYFSYTEHYNYPIKTLFLSLIYPLLYCVLIFLKGHFKFGMEYEHSKNYYPYFFVDLESLGIQKVAKNIGFVLAGILAIGLITIFINNTFLVEKDLISRMVGIV